MGEAAYELAPKSGQAWFGQYGKHFQEKIFQALVSDNRFAAAYTNAIMTLNWFLFIIVELCFGYFVYARKREK